MFKKIYNKFINDLSNKIIEKSQNTQILNDLSFKVDLLIKESSYPKYDAMNLFKNSEDKRPKILIVGYYGGGSLGDELMLEALISKLDTEKFNITIMLSPNEQTDVTKYKNVNIVYVPVKIYELQRFGNYFDTIILGGGAVLDDWYYLLENYHMTFATTIINLLYYFALNDKLVIVYGVSTNKELKNKDFIKKLNYIVDEAEHFSVRDSYSLNTLKEAGISPKKVKVVHDLVFSQKDLQKPLKTAKQNAYKILISFNIQEDNKAANLEIVEKLIKFLDKNNQSNFEIGLFPYFTHKDWDQKYLEEMKDKLNDNRVIIEQDVNNFKELLLLMENYNYFITGRYHMFLISNSLAKKSILLNYDTHRHYENKNKYLLNNYNFEKNIINLSEMKNIEDNFEKLFSKNNLNLVDKNILQSANKELEAALKKLNKLIKK